MGLCMYKLMLVSATIACCFNSWYGFLIPDGAVDHTVVICNAIEKSEFLTDTQSQLLVDKILSVISA
jgi:hypothetical protein